MYLATIVFITLGHRDIFIIIAWVLMGVNGRMFAPVDDVVPPRGGVDGRLGKNGQTGKRFAALACREV